MVQTIIIIGCFLIYALASVTDTLKGATLSLILEETGFSYSLGGTIVTGFYLGYMAATLATGVISDWLGKKSALLIAAVFIALGVVGMAWAHSPLSFVGASILNGFGCGATVLGTSRFVTALRPGSAGLYLNLLGATFGLISMLTPYYVALVRRLGGSWREAFLYTIAGSLLCLVWFVPIRCPEDRDGVPAHTRLPELVKAVMSREVRLFYLVVLFFFTVEVGIGTWLIEYVTRAKGLSAETGSSYLSLYYGSIMTGRFAGSLVVERIGRDRLLRLASLAALLCITVGALGPDRALPLLPLSGLFFSVIFPTATACVSAIGTDNPGAVFGVLFAFVGIGGMSGPWLIGLVNDFLGVEWGIGLAIGFGLALALSIHFAVKPLPKTVV